MNTSNLTQGQIEVPFFTAEDILKYLHIIRSIAVLGVLLNLTTILLLLKKKFEHKFYDFLRCRCFCNLIVCIFSTYTSRLQCRGCESDYIDLIINVFVIQWPTRSAYIASAISDNLLILYRLVNLYQWTDSVFMKLSKKVNFFFFLFFDCSFNVSPNFSKHTFLSWFADSLNRRFDS